MELILISNTKLKIMLNENDMQRYKIGSESDCAEPDTRRAIRSLLDCAREQIGFNTEGEEIFVQLYTSKKGGCELFVTKCHDSALCEESAERLIKSVGSSYDSHYSSRRRDAEHVSSTTVKERKMISTTQEKKERIAFSFPDCKSLLPFDEMKAALHDMDIEKSRHRGIRVFLELPCLKIRIQIRPRGGGLVCLGGDPAKGYDQRQCNQDIASHGFLVIVLLEREGRFTTRPFKSYLDTAGNTESGNDNAVVSPLSPSSSSATVSSTAPIKTHQPPFSASR